MNPTTYTTLDGEVLDLTGLSPAQKEFLNVCYAIFRQRGNWKTLTELVRGSANPLIGAGRRVTREVANHPLYLATRDLEDRLGLITGNLAPEPGDDPTTDPLEDALLTVADAATLKGTTTMAVRKAIERGDLVATKGRPQRVSKRSLGLWAVNTTRQKARMRELTHA